MTYLFISRRWFRVIYLGPTLTAEDLIDAIQEIRPPRVLLSASTPEGAADLARSSLDVKRACATLDEGACVPETGFAGRVFLDMPFLQDGGGGIFCGRDIDEAVGVTETALSGAVVAADPARHRCPRETNQL